MRDPRPWHRALATLPECFTVTAFEWWGRTGKPMIQLCVLGHAISMRPRWLEPGYSVYWGSIEATEWIERAHVDDDELACVVVTHLRAAALDAVKTLVQGYAI